MGKIQRLARGIFSLSAPPLPPSIPSLPLFFLLLSLSMRQQYDDLAPCSENLTHKSLLNTHMHIPWHPECVCHTRPWSSSLKPGISRAGLSSILAFISLLCSFSSLSFYSWGTPLPPLISLIMFLNSNKPQAMFSEFISLFDVQHGENYCPLKRHVVKYILCFVLN